MARSLVTAGACWLALLPSMAARAEAPRFEIGPRFLLVTAGGDPTNDQMGLGIFGRYRLNDRWLVGASIDVLGGDVERPYEKFGLTSPEEIDSNVDSTVVSGWIEREHGRLERKLKWFWSAGLGFASPDVDDVTGPLSGGGTFDITTDAGSEVVLSLAGGLRRRLSRRLGLEVALRADQHFADWKMTERNGGARAAFDDYTLRGLHVGLGLAF